VNQPVAAVDSGGGNEAMTADWTWWSVLVE